MFLLYDVLILMLIVVSVLMIDVLGVMCIDWLLWCRCILKLLVGFELVLVLFVFVVMGFVVKCLR